MNTQGGSNDQGNALRRGIVHDHGAEPRRGIGATLVLMAAAWLASCDDRSAGTNDETHTEVAARILMPDGTTPAAGAAVTLVPVDGTVAAARGQVDADGHPEFASLADGIYAMTAATGPLASWTDSVKVVAGRLELEADDTLAEAGSISGIVLPQPQHDARTIVVNVLGTDAWANVGQDGRFTIPLLGAGVLRLKFATTLPDYTALYQTVKLDAGKGWVFPDTLRLPYTGIPVVEGLQAANDSATGDILLSWKAATHAHLVDYVIYRDSAGAVEYSSKPYASSVSTSWRDTAASSTLRKLGWRYRVAVRVSGNVLPGDWFEVVEAVSVPPELAHLEAIAWASLGAPGGSFGGFLGGRYASASLEVGTDSVRLPVWSSLDGSGWTVGGRSFSLRRMGQTIVRVAGFGSGRIWCFGHSGIGDGVEASSSADGATWTTTTIPDSLWPGETGLFVTGSASQVALVAPGSRSVVLSGDTSGGWHLTTVTGRVLGVDDSGIWTDAGLSRPTRVDLATGREVRVDLGTWSGDALGAIVTWQGGTYLRAGNRLWAREGSIWTPRAAPTLNLVASSGDRLLVRDTLGTFWRGQ